MAANRRELPRRSEFSAACGRDEAIAETGEAADSLFKRMRELPARTQAGRAAKVRALIRYVLGDKWRGTDGDLDWPEESAPSSASSPA